MSGEVTMSRKRSQMAWRHKDGAGWGVTGRRRQQGDRETCTVPSTGFQGTSTALCLNTQCLKPGAQEPFLELLPLQCILWAPTGGLTC